MDCIISDDIVLLIISADCSAVLITGSFISQSHKTESVKNIEEYI